VNVPRDASTTIIGGCLMMVLVWLGGGWFCG
jgi:hypothetical protein